MTRDDLDACQRVINEMISNGSDGIADAAIDIVVGKYAETDRPQLDNELRYFRSLTDVSFLVRDAYNVIDGD